MPSTPKSPQSNGHNDCFASPGAGGEDDFSTMELRLRSAAKSELRGCVHLLKFYRERGSVKEACDAVREHVSMRMQECFNSQPWLECATQCFKSYAADSDLSAPMSTCYAKLLCALIELHLHKRNQVDAEIALWDLNCFLSATESTSTTTRLGSLDIESPSTTETHARFLSLAANLLSLRLQRGLVQNTVDARKAAARLYQATYLLAHELNANDSTPLLHFIEFEALSMHTTLQSKLRDASQQQLNLGVNSPRRVVRRLPTDNEVFDCVFPTKVGSALSSAMEPLLRSVDSIGGRLPESVNAKLTELYSNHVSLFDVGSLQRVLWFAAQVWNEQSQTPLANFPFSKALPALPTVPPNLGALETTSLDTLCSIDCMAFFYLACWSSNCLDIAARTPYLLMGSMSTDYCVSVWNVLHAVGQSNAASADQRPILRQLLEVVRCMRTDSFGSRLVHNFAVLLEEKAASAANEELALAFRSYAKLYWKCLILKLETPKSVLRRPASEPLFAIENPEFSYKEIPSVLDEARAYRSDRTPKPMTPRRSRAFLSNSSGDEQVVFTTPQSHHKASSEVKIVEVDAKLMEELRADKERLLKENKDLLEKNDALREELTQAKVAVGIAQSEKALAVERATSLQEEVAGAKRALQAESTAHQSESVALREELAKSNTMLAVAQEKAERLQGDCEDLKKDLEEEKSRRPTPTQAEQLPLPPLLQFQLQQQQADMLQYLRAPMGAGGPPMGTGGPPVGIAPQNMGPAQIAPAPFVPGQQFRTTGPPQPNTMFDLNLSSASGFDYAPNNASAVKEEERTPLGRSKEQEPQTPPNDAVVPGASSNVPSSACAQPFKFSALVQPTSPARPQEVEAVAETAGSDDEDEADNHDPHYDPIIALPELVRLETGEEQEDVLFERRAKLYRWSNEEWKERAVGDAKLLKNKTTKRVRFVMRREQIHKVAANHLLTSGMRVTPHPSGPRSLIWFAMDATDADDGAARAEQYCIRFKTEDDVAAFERAFNGAVGEAPKTPAKEPDNTPSTPKSASKPTPPQFVPQPASSTQKEAFGMFSKQTEQAKAVPVSNVPQFGNAAFGSKTTQPAASISGAATNPAPFGSTIAPFKPDVPPPAIGSSIFGGLTNPVTSPPVFGSIHGQSATFGSLAKEQEGTLFGKPVTNKITQFGSTSAKATSPSVQPIFSSGQEGASHEEAGGADEAWEPSVEYKPVLEKLPDLVEARTGEEEETVKFCEHAKLFRYDSDTNENKERGVGELKILHSESKQQCRIVMRREIVHKLCANHKISETMELKPRGDKAFTFTAMDFADEELKKEIFTVKFKTADIAQSFKGAFEDAVSQAKNKKTSSGPKPALEKTEATTTNNWGFSNLASSANKWECQACFVRNDAAAECCACCQTGRDGSAPKKADPFSKTAGPPKPVAASGFSFGIGAGTAANNSFGIPEAFGNSTFGSPSIDNTLGSLSSVNTTGNSFGPPAVSDSEAPQLGGFSFNFGAKPPSPAKEVVPAKPPGAFSSFSFGSPADTSTPSFGVPAAKSGDGATASPAKGFTFSMNPTASPAEAAPAAKEGHESEGDDHDDAAYDPHYDPIVSLPEQDVQTGEEEEEVLHVVPRCKLYRYTDNQWKERGLGELKILQHVDTGAVRIVMRREQTHKVCANHCLVAGMKLDFKEGSDKILTWFAPADNSDDDLPPSPQKFCLKLPNPSDAASFKASFDDALTRITPADSPLRAAKDAGSSGIAKSTPTADVKASFSFASPGVSDRSFTTASAASASTKDGSFLSANSSKFLAKLQPDSPVANSTMPSIFGRSAGSTNNQPTVNFSFNSPSSSVFGGAGSSTFSFAQKPSTASSATSFSFATPQRQEDDDDVQVVFDVSTVIPKELRDKARRYMLPDNFYAYTQKQTSCPGCRGCEDSDGGESPPEVDQRVPTDAAEFGETAGGPQSYEEVPESERDYTNNPADYEEDEEDEYATEAVRCEFDHVVLKIGMPGDADDKMTIGEDGVLTVWDTQEEQQGYLRFTDENGSVCMEHSIFPWLAISRRQNHCIWAPEDDEYLDPGMLVFVTFAEEVDAETFMNEWQSMTAAGGQ